MDYEKFSNSWGEVFSSLLQLSSLMVAWGSSHDCWAEEMLCWWGFFLFSVVPISEIVQQSKLILAVDSWFCVYNFWNVNKTYQAAAVKFRGRAELATVGYFNSFSPNISLLLRHGASEKRLKYRRRLTTVIVDGSSSSNQARNSSTYWRVRFLVKIICYF